MDAINPTVRAWFSDPKFIALSEREQREVLEGYFDQELVADDARFSGIAPAVQEATRRNFADMHLQAFRPAPARGVLTDTAVAVGRGLAGVGELGLKAGAGALELGAGADELAGDGLDEPMRDRAAKLRAGAGAVADWRDDVLPESQESRAGGIRGAWTRGVESTVTSLGTMVPAWAATVLSGGTGLLPIVAGMVSGLPAFGLSQYDEALGRYQGQGLTRGEAQAPALIEGASEIGTELASDVFELATLGVGRGLSVPGKAVLKSSVRELLARSWRAAAGKGAAVAAAEVAGESLNSIIQTATQDKFGTHVDDFWGVIGEQLGPITVAGLLFGGLGGTIHYRDASRVERLIATPVEVGSDAAANERALAMRQSAVEEVAAAIERQSPVLAGVWRRNAATAVEQNAAIDTEGQLFDENAGPDEGTQGPPEQGLGAGADEVTALGRGGGASDPLAASAAHRKAVLAAEKEQAAAEESAEEERQAQGAAAEKQAIESLPPEERAAVLEEFLSPGQVEAIRKQATGVSAEELARAFPGDGPVDMYARTVGELAGTTGAKRAEESASADGNTETQKHDDTTPGVDVDGLVRTARAEAAAGDLLDDLTESGRDVQEQADVRRRRRAAEILGVRYQRGDSEQAVIPEARKHDDTTIKNTTGADVLPPTEEERAALAARLSVFPGTRTMVAALRRGKATAREYAQAVRFADDFERQRAKMSGVSTETQKHDDTAPGVDVDGLVRTARAETEAGDLLDDLTESGRDVQEQADIRRRRRASEMLGVRYQGEGSEQAVIPETRKHDDTTIKNTTGVEMSGVSTETQKHDNATTPVGAKQWTTNRVAERYVELALSDEGLHLPFANAMKNARLLLRVVETGEYSDVIGPQNKLGRKIYTEITGEKLPKGRRAPQKFFGGRKAGGGRSATDPVSGPDSVPVATASAPATGTEIRKHDDAATQKYGAGNKVFTSDAAVRARELLKKKLGQVSAGLDPELLQAGITLAGFHVEAGARSFGDYARAMVADLGGAVRPYLKSFYNALRDFPGFDSAGMTAYDEVSGADVATITGEERDEHGAGGQGQAALEEVAATEDQGVGAGGAVRDAGAPGGGTGGRGDTATDGVRSPASRGGGDGAARVHPVAAGKRGGGSGKGRRGPRPGEEVSQDDGVAARLVPSPAPTTVPAANFRITPEVRLGKGGEAEKFRDNLAAIVTLHRIEAERRRATPDEQRILARYVGWGGLASAFAHPDTGAVKTGWEERSAQLAALLTPDELAAARRSTQNAHYTSETVVSAMWRAAVRLGFAGGLVLEPSAGTGNFLGLIPEELAGQSRFVAVEYDAVTARIASALYPQAAVFHTGFQKVPLAAGAFDLAIGNPPFGSNSLFFQFKPDLSGLSIHNQFFLASLDAVRPGGLQVMVVSRFLMDAKDSRSREMLATRARLLGAIRLPDTAFRENARTEVVTDILFLQRLTAEEEEEMKKVFQSSRTEPPANPARPDEYNVPDWVGVTAVNDQSDGEPITVNRYFAQHPEMVVGSLARSGSMYRENDVTVHLGPEADFPALLDAAVARLPEGIARREETAVARSVQRFEGLRGALDIALSGGEEGSVAVDRAGVLRQVIERETPEGGHELFSREVTPESPWSPQLFMDAAGNWYRNVKKLDVQGDPVKQGRFNVYEREVFPAGQVPKSLLLGEAKFQRLTGLLKLRDLLKRQIRLEMEDQPPAELEAARLELRESYQAYVRKWGHINASSNAGVLSGLPDAALVLALEMGYRPGLSVEQARKRGEEARPDEARPAAILAARVVRPYVPPERAESPADALAIVLSETGRVDMERLATLLGKSEEEAVAVLTGRAPLVFRDPESGAWETRDAYLSGNIKRKLAAAEAAGAAVNAAALREVLPEPWGADKVTVHIGAAWVPTDVYAAFCEHLTGNPARVGYGAITNTFSVRMESSTRGEQWGTEHTPVGVIVESLLNSRSVVVRTPADSEGRTQIDKEATAMSQLKAKQVEAEFEDWVFRDAERRQRLTALYNERYNTRVSRQYDGSHLTLPGKVPDMIIRMRRHQNNAIWRGISSRFLLLDHVVGSGKTFTAIARVMERRRMGLARKPMVVVPNHMIEQFTSDIYRLYPGAKVLAATKKDFEKTRRRKLFARIATGDWDVVVVAHSSFGKIGISPETEERFVAVELDEARAALQEAEEEWKDEGGRFKPPTVKEAERLVERLEQRIERLRAGQQGKDQLLTFEQMGVDDLTVDEAHEFKNLFYHSRMTGVRGMGDKLGSHKAFDLYNKVRVLRESPRGAVTFMTGTPISNSAVELYTMMRYLAADDLRERGEEHFDAWRSQYVSAEPKYEPTESGRLKEVTRLGRSWGNMRSLMELYYSFADAVTTSDIRKAFAEDNPGREFPVPEVAGGERQRIVVEPTAAQAEMLDQILADFQRLDSIKNPSERNAARLRLMDRARKLSLDARAVDPHTQSLEQGGKLDRVADEVARIYRKWEGDRGAQLIFLDRSIPKSKGDTARLREYDELTTAARAALAGEDEDAYRAAVDKLDAFDADEMAELRMAQTANWNAYQQIKDNLVARGVPEAEIRFVQEANTDAQKSALFDAVNAGEVRILIGSTPRMGAGTNVQERLTGLHHVDVTWKPSDIEQREGRIIRQGNSLHAKYGKEFKVEILAYATKRTMDAKMWDLNAEKLKMLNGIRKYDGAFTMEFDDSDSVGMAEMAALASGDPRLLERVQLQAEIERLEMLERGYRRQRYQVDDEIGRAEKAVANNPAVIATAKEYAASAAAARNVAIKHAKARRVTVEGKEYGDHMAAAQAVKAAKDASGKEGEERDKVKINLDGRSLSSESSIHEAVSEALGDATPFLAAWGGREHIRRTAMAREMARAATELAARLEKGGHEVVGTSGQLFGFDAQVEVERNSFYDKWEVTLVLRQGGATVDHWSKQVESATVSAQVIRELIGRAEDYLLGGGVETEIADRERRMAEAERDLPVLRARAGEQFPKAVELADKRARVKALTAELAREQAVAGNDDDSGPRFSRSAGDRDNEVGGENEGLRSDLTLPAEAEAAALARLDRSLANHASRFGLDYRSGQLQAAVLDGAPARIARAAARQFGRGVVFVRNRSGFAFDGVVIPELPGVIFLDAAATTPHLALVGHELTHHLESARPDLYQYLLDNLQAELRDDAAFREEIFRRLAPAERASGSDPAFLAREFAGDMVGGFFLDSGFWDRMAARASQENTTGLFRRLAQAVQRFLVRLLAQLRPAGGPDTAAARYLKDFERAREVVADVFSQWHGEVAGGGGVEFSRRDVALPVFYSELAAQVARSLPGSGPASMLLAAIRAWGRKGLFRGEELAWTGLEDWLEERGDAKTTRPEVEEYLAAHGVRVEEVVKGGAEGRAALASSQGTGPVRFDRYQTPGGKNYRELLLTVDRLPSARGGEEAYRSPHWEETNVLAHVRFNERMIDGQRTLFIEEVQSDWHQQGRRKGYHGSILDAGQRQRLAELNELLAGRPQDLTFPLREEWLALRDLAQNQSGVPDVPFKKTWPLFAMKRMVRWAAENGFERVAWVSGAMPVSRFGLSGQKAGSEGMAAFYDRELVNEVKRYVRRWGATVEPMTIAPGWPGADGRGYRLSIPSPSGQELRTYHFDRADAEAAAALLPAGMREKTVIEEHPAVEVHGFRVTGDMEAGAMAGQPLFRRPDLARPVVGVAALDDYDRDRSFANRIFEQRDVGKHQAEVIANGIQTRIQGLAGPESQRRHVLGFAYSRHRRSGASDLLDQALMVWRDMQTAPEREKEFRDWSARQLAIGSLPVDRREAITKQLAILDRAARLTEEEKEVARDVGKLYERLYQVAEANGVIQSHRENYVRRIWKFDRSTGGTVPAVFRVSTTAAKGRTLATILDGWMAGYELAVTGLSTSYGHYHGELEEVLANRDFVRAGYNTRDAQGRRLFATSNRGEHEGYVKLDAAGFHVWEWAGKSTVEVDDPASPAALIVDDHGRRFFSAPVERIPEGWAVHASGGAGSPSSRALRLFETREEAEAWAGKRPYSTTIKHRKARDMEERWERRELYAPAGLAHIVNRATAKDRLFAESPGLQALVRFNARVKSWVLLSSFFHHMAGVRSWVFGVNHGWRAQRFVLPGGEMVEAGGWNPVAAYKRGLDMVAGLHPLVTLGVRNGLTLGDIQTWSEGFQRTPGLARRLAARLGLTRTGQVLDRLQAQRERWEDSLFKKFFAGLKAHAFVVEYAHLLQAAHREHLAGRGPAPAADLLAERAARLINEDFGGLHLGRMGRHPTPQKILRLALLAPDWTESNFRMVTGLVPGLNDWISRMFGETREPAGMRELYTKFFGRVALRAAAATILLQLMLNGWDDSEEFWREQFTGDNWRKFRWLMVDLKNVYKFFGVELEGKRPVFSVFGHFADPLKLIDPMRLGKGKGSPLLRAGLAWGSGSDWTERPFTNARDLLLTGKTVKGSRYDRKEGSLEALPSVVVNQVLAMQPIQAGNFVKWLQGEDDGLTMLLASAGGAVHYAWPAQMEGPVAAAGAGLVAAAAARLKDAEVLKLGPPARTLTERGVPVKLTPADYRELVTESSRLAEAALARLIGSERWPRLAAETQAKIIEEEVTAARREVRERIKSRIRHSRLSRENSGAVKRTTGPGA